MGGFLAAPATRRLALAGAAAVLVLLAVELGLRVAGAGAPAWHRPDALLGWRLRPYARGPHLGQYAQVNAFGQRDVAHDGDKPEGVYRIAVLGDEQSEAMGLALRDTWWWQLPQELDRCGFASGKKIEMLNFGVAGYSTAQESLVLETAALRYRPDLVLLQLSTGKDVGENSRGLAGRLDRPFYGLDARGRLRLDDSFLDRRDFERRSQFRYELARALADHSRLAQLLAEVTLLGRAHADAGDAHGALVPPADPRWAQAWHITEALLQRMQAYAGRNGARLVVVTAPSPLQLERGLDYPDARLEAFGAARNLPVIAIAPQLRPRRRE
ncbi:MAG TPA: SGNH/GDSL hydrolase family protein, partial [Burkholderiales bacterium]|nr:SGNH/GDSL hydrolase family protein [Burkholderiales bacterium]